MIYTPKNGAEIYLVAGSQDPAIGDGTMPLSVPFTMKREQSLGRLHRPVKSNIRHVWIDENPKIDERVFASLARKGAEQAIRAAVTANWEKEYGNEMARRTKSDEPAS